jgi:hypothetical protein
MTTVLELNDADLTLYRDARPVHRAPGIAVLLDQRILFGDEAARLARIHPRQANQQYFTRLSAEPLPYATARARNHADLVYLHLLELADLIEGRLIVAVPGVFTADQLGVLLGILQEARIDAGGFVDSAVAAASAAPVDAQTWHLDVMLQRAVLTRLTTVDGSIEKAGVQEFPECGLARLVEAWINVVADRFVRETRFDPLHAAQTEQQLFDQIFERARQGASSGDLIFEITQGEHSRRVELARSVLEDKAAQRYRLLVDALPDGARVLLSARSARLPGLPGLLNGAGIGTFALPEDALARGCERHLEAILTPGEELHLVTRLPFAAPPPVAESVEAPAAPGVPTHALHGIHAIPLGSRRLAFATVHHGTTVLVKAQEGVRLNDAAVVRDTALEAGDRIGCGADEFLIIHVER